MKSGLQDGGNEKWMWRRRHMRWKAEKREMNERERKKRGRHERIKVEEADEMQGRSKMLQ